MKNNITRTTSEKIKCLVITLLSGHMAGRHVCCIVNAVDQNLINIKPM